MATYTDIRKDEMVDHLTAQGFKEIQLPGTSEMVMGKILKKNVCLRVYTTIARGSQSRDVGKDAIRCTVFYRRVDGEVRMWFGAKRVHRVKNWKTNLDARIQSTIEEYNNRVATSK